MTRYPNSLELMTACHELAQGSMAGLSDPAELVRGCLQAMAQDTTTTEDVQTKADRLYQRLRRLNKLDWGLVVAAIKGLQLAPMDSAPAKEAAAS